MEFIKITKKIWTIQDFLRATICNDLIKKSEKIGYQEATVSLPDGGKMMKGLRDNYRVTFIDAEFAENLFRNIEDFLPVLDECSTAVGLSEMVRFYRYDKTQRFKRHIDGRVRDAGRESRLTFMVYLNDNFLGGETKFDDTVISPKKGMALMFIHEQKHESLPIRSGTKYVLRSDVFYDSHANSTLT